VYPVGCGVFARRRKLDHSSRLVKLGLLFCLGVLAAAAVLWQLAPRHSRPATFSAPQTNRPVPFKSSENHAVTSADYASPSVARGVSRVVYPYSLIPGGVHDPEELRLVSALDTVVASNFAGFDFQRATVERLKEPKLVYLAYRLGNRVYWTKKKIRLVAGETLITDGKITARTRCANPVSESAQGPYSPKEPAAYKFEKPIGGEEGTAAQLTFPSQFDEALLSQPEMPALVPAAPPVVVPPIPVTPVAAAPKGWWFIPPVVPPIPGGGGSSTPPALPPGITPEPSTILLISTGLAGVYVRYRRGSKK
jgi:hypothetical protein